MIIEKGEWKSPKFVAVGVKEDVGGFVLVLFYGPS